MIIGDEALAKPAWRWPIIFGTIFANIFANFLCWGAMLIGSAMGWSGRSNVQIGLILVLLILSVVVTAVFGNRAIQAANKKQLKSSLTQFLPAVLAAPLAWALLNIGVFGP